MNILITGASKGIGFELTKIFAENKHNVITLSRNVESLINQAFVNLANNAGQLYSIPFDLSKLEGNEQGLYDKIISAVDHIDIVINNAGEVLRKPFEEITNTEMHDIFEINFFAPAKLIQILLPLLESAKQAHVVNISSIGGVMGSQKFNGLSMYSSSKAALQCLTECLAEEFKSKSISFNCLAFGAVQTDMLNRAFPGYKAPVKPDEMAKFVYEFALNGNKFFNGKILPVSLSTP